MVRGFGLLLVVGVASPWRSSLVAVPDGTGAAARLERAAPARPRRARQRLGAAGDAALAAAGASPAPARVLAVALVLALAGLGARHAHGGAVGHHQAGAVEHAGAPASRHARAVTGVSGEVDVVVHSATSPTPRRSLDGRLRAAGDRSLRLLRALGAARAQRSARRSHCRTSSARQRTAGAEAIVAARAVPGYFQRAVLTPDHRYALLAFGIRLMPLQPQRQVIEHMRAAARPAARGQRPARGPAGAGRGR